jgi:hypothetical protein
MVINMKRLLVILLVLISVAGFAVEQRGPYDPGAARKNLSNATDVVSLDLSQRLRAAWAEITGNIYASGSARLEAGTAAAPAYSFAADPDTGIYSAGADTLGFAVGGAFAGQWNSAGELLIATSTDAGVYPLQVNGYSYSHGYDLPRNTRIGWASKVDTFTLNGVSTVQNGLTFGPTVGDYVTLAGYYGLNWVTNSLERMRVTSGGNVLIATSTDDGVNKLQVNGKAYFYNDVSALSFTDRTPAPANLAESYAIIESHRVKSGELDHAVLHPAAWGKKIRREATGRTIKRKNDKDEEIEEPEFEEFAEPDQTKRNLSITITAQALVIQDLIRRIEKLEGKK